MYCDLNVSFGSVVTTCDFVSFLQPAPSLSQCDDHNLTNDEHHPSRKKPQPPTVDNHPSCPTSTHPGNDVAHQQSIWMCHIVQPSPIHNGDNKRKTMNNNSYPSATTVQLPPTTTMHANNNMALPHHQLEEARQLMVMTWHVNRRATSSRQ